MRRVLGLLARGVPVALLVVLLSGSALAAPQERDREFRDRDSASPVVRMIKKVIRAFGDGMTVPRP